MNMQTTPETEVSTSMTEDQAAEEMLKRWAKDDEPAAPEAEEEAEAEQPQGDADAEDEPEEEGAESDDVEIDVGGEKFKLPNMPIEAAKHIEAKVKEIEAGATRKFQEAAELRKVAESQMEAAKQIGKLSEQQADLLTDHKLVERRLRALESIDAAQMDDGALARLNHEYNQLNAAKARIEQAYKEVTGKTQEEQAKQHAARLSSLNEYAKKNVKGWSAEYSQTLLDFATKELGADPEFIRQNVSEVVIKALDLAYQGWKVRSTDPKAKQVQSTKTLKPGSNAGVKTNAVVNADKAFQRLKSGGRTEDAAAAILARAGVKRR
jgi:hypothetical protein